MCLRQHIIIYCQAYCGRVVKDIHNTVDCSDKRRKGYCWRREREEPKPMPGEKCSYCHSRGQRQEKRVRDVQPPHFTRDLEERRELAKDRTKRIETVSRQGLIGASPRRQMIDVGPRLLEVSDPVRFPKSSRRDWRPSHGTRDAGPPARGMGTGKKDGAMGRGSLGINMGMDEHAKEVGFKGEYGRRASPGKEMTFTALQGSRALGW
jgi:hypothetical protein